MDHLELKNYKFYINDDPGLILAYSSTESKLVAYAFIEGQAIRKLFNEK